MQQGGAWLGAQHAALDHAQRFGGSLDLNLHFHAVFTDGVFATDDAGRIQFHGLPPPPHTMLDRVVRRVRDRTLRWLRKHALLDERPVEDRSNERTEGGALDACADIALRGGAFASLDRRGSAPVDDSNARFEPKKRGPFTAELTIPCRCAISRRPAHPPGRADRDPPILPSS